MFLQQLCVVFLFVFYLFVFGSRILFVSIIYVLLSKETFHGYDILDISINNVFISNRQEHWEMLNVNLKY